MQLNPSFRAPLQLAKEHTGVAVLSRGRAVRMQSLFNSKGGRPSKQATPGEREGLALAVAAAMQWSKLRDSSNKMFFTNIAATVKRLEGTERDWTKAEMVQFVQNTLFGGIPQYAVEAWIQKEFIPKRGEQITEHRRVIIENFMYRYLASVDSGVDFESALSLASRANLGAVLSCKELGGCAEWTV